MQDLDTKSGLLCSAAQQYLRHQKVEHVVLESEDRALVVSTGDMLWSVLLVSSTDAIDEQKLDVI